MDLTSIKTLALTSKTKLVITVAFASICLVITIGSLLTANHYHSAWIKTGNEITKLTTEQKQLLTSLSTCTESVKKGKELADKKEKEAKEALEKAEVISKKNQAFSQELLVTKPSNSLNLCESAVSLYKDYKVRIETENKESKK